MKTTSEIIQEMTKEHGDEWLRACIKAFTLSQMLELLVDSRKAAKMSQLDVAVILGKYQSCVHIWEHDTEGKLAVEHYVELLLAIGQVPVVTLVPIAEVKEQLLNAPKELQAYIQKAKGR